MARIITRIVCNQTGTKLRKEFRPGEHQLIAILLLDANLQTEYFTVMRINPSAVTGGNPTSENQDVPGFRCSNVFHNNIHYIGVLCSH